MFQLQAKTSSSVLNMHHQEIHLYEHFHANLREDEHLYLILDCAHHRKIYSALDQSKYIHSSLISNKKSGEPLKAASPYVVKLKSGSPFMDACLSLGFGRHWYLLFASQTPHVSELVRHFKRFNKMRLENGKRYLFRYYDPRVLPYYLDGCSESERQGFFGDVRCFWIPDLSIRGESHFTQLNRDGSKEVFPLDKNTNINTASVELRYWKEVLTC